MRTHDHLWTDPRLPVPHLASYTRISKDPLGIAASPELQREDNASIARDRWPDLPIVLYEDRDRSAWTGERRPAYEAMLERVKSGEVAAIVAYNQDRLLRLPRQLEELIDLCDAKRFRNFATATGDLDLTSDDGQFKARIIAAVTKKSSDDTSRRVKRALRAKRERGEWVGRLPYGVVRFEDGRPVPDPKRLAIIERVRDGLLAGESLASLMRWAHEQDPERRLTRPGWRRVLLTSPLLSPQDRANIRAVLSAPGRRTVWSNRRRSWLSGLLVCDVCSAALARKPSANDGAGQWRCPENHVAIHLTKTEEAVQAMIFEAARVHRPAPVASEPALPPPDAQERLERLARLYVAGALTDAEWEAARAAVLPPAEPEPTITPDVVDVEAAWPGWTPVERHRFAARLLAEVRVRRADPSAPRREFRVERLVPRWRV